MKQLVTTILMVLVIGMSWQCKRPLSSITGPRYNTTPLRDSLPGVLKALPDTTFNRNELIVFARQPLTPANVELIKDAMRKKGIDVSSLNIKTCNSCANSVQLWQAPDIYTYVVAEGVRSGSGGGSTSGVGEDSLARYSLNYTISIPADSLIGIGASLANYNKQTYPVNNLAGKNIIKIAVLDTGVDTTRFIHNSYLWRNPAEGANSTDDDKNCYTNDIAGWNFLTNDANFHDDDANVHGSLVTKYIIDQFQSVTTNGVQILALKTHDANSSGNLFAAICALHYAIDQKVNVINASWGFYNYFNNPVPYLDSLLTRVLPANGILFITAAGNKMELFDSHARDLYRAANGTDIPEHALRNLQVHNFYPAVLSRSGNGVITTTTTDGRTVSRTQNYSSLYVDLAVQADEVTATTMKFRVPFTVSSQFISGSSFATAIATGRIGARFQHTLYVPGVNKDDVFTNLGRNISRSAELEINSLVRGGRYIRSR